MWCEFEEFLILIQFLCTEKVLPLSDNLMEVWPQNLFRLALYLLKLMINILAKVHTTRHQTMKYKHCIPCSSLEERSGMEDNLTKRQTHMKTTSQKDNFTGRLMNKSNGKENILKWKNEHNLCKRHQPTKLNLSLAQLIPSTRLLSIFLKCYLILKIVSLVFSRTLRLKGLRRRKLVIC